MPWPENLEETYRSRPPNYDNPPTRTGLLMGVLIPFAVLMTLALAGRFYSRGYIKRILGLDDWLMLGAWFLTLAWMITVLVCTRYGFGRHLWDVKLNWFDIVTKIKFSFEIFFALGVGLTKISVCLGYLRAFPPEKGNLWFCRCAIAYTVLWVVSVVAVMILQFILCVSIHSPHTPPIRLNTCVKHYEFILASGALNTLSDLFIFLWPLRFVLGLRLSRDKRVGLMILFALGTMVSIAGVCRLWYFTKFFKTQDIFWTGVYNDVILSIETTLGVICGCLPCCHPILVNICPRFRWFHSQGSQPESTDDIDGTTQEGTNSSLAGRKTADTPFGWSLTGRKTLTSQREGDYIELDSLKGRAPGDRSSTATSPIHETPEPIAEPSTRPMPRRFDTTDSAYFERVYGLNRGSSLRQHYFDMGRPSVQRGLSMQSVQERLQLNRGMSSNSANYSVGRAPSIRRSSWETKEVDFGYSWDDPHPGRKVII
ncbi:hypothetical protein IWX90DRAFT_39429 [Phyllosticta citrichinensis]|uniref:Rhodopsin domain-containing protein n=1 Tax=Phyllosticta citrichinensis TaxID=1130410 RepID=A0ABR1Y8L9_9PEZI